MDTGAGNDEIMGTSANRGISTSSDSITDTGDGNDKITGIGTSENDYGIVTLVQWILVLVTTKLLVQALAEASPTISTAL
jgi:hypothetical protein